MAYTSSMSVQNEHKKLLAVRGVVNALLPPLHPLVCIDTEGYKFGPPLSSLARKRHTEANAEVGKVNMCTRRVDL